MSTHSDEEIELSDESDSVKKRSFSSEQEESLLGGWKERTEADEVSRTQYKRGRLWTWQLWLGIAVTVGIILVGVYGLIYGFVHSDRHRSEGLFDVQTPDYVLDARWDYDAPPQRREYHWTVRDQVHNPDGVYRPMMLVNSQFPGPLIEVNEGDTVVVHVDNQAVNATSIHWHGMYQNGTPYMDGTVGITQCPIAPGKTFTYEFTVSGQSGTYWWHGHYGIQSADGMHGPLIIHARNERQMQQIEYDTDRVVLVSDHYHDLSSALLWQYLAPDRENEEPIPDSGLINGRSIVDCDLHRARKCDNTSSHVGPHTLDLAPNQLHRLRFINVGAFVEFQVQVDEHELAVTEVDGTDVVPVHYHRLNISPAQRYSVIVNTNVTTANSFWLRARMQTYCFKEPIKMLPNLNPDIVAVVRYEDSDETPTSVDWTEALDLECKDMNTTDLHPVESISPPTTADAYFSLRANFEIGKYRLSRGVFNTSSFRTSPRSPTLSRAISGLSSSDTPFLATSASNTQANDSVFLNTEAFSKDTQLTVQTTGIQTLDLLISNFDDGSHPLHLHGYKYFVLAQGHGYPPKKSVFEELTRENVQPLYDSLDLTNPLRRDTASVEGFGWILLRVVADNAGMWAFHCHVSWHSEAGLMMQFLTRSEGLVGMDEPRGNRELCKAEGVDRGMGPDDEDYRDLALG